MDARALVQAAAGYVKRNPDEIVKAAVNLVSLRFGIPIAALRYFVAQMKPGKKAPKDVEIGTKPPALTLAGTVDAMGTPIRASASVKIDELRVSSDSIRVTLRLRDVKLALLAKSESPVATLIQSGALDLSKPGNLVKFLPKKPPAIVEAEDDKIVLELMKIPKIAENPRVRKLLSVITPVVGIKVIETDADHLYVALKATPMGILQVVDAIRDKNV
ncbi:MAG: hypothetical protein U0169_01740 [Polyangiaceae bacterium]